MGLTQSTAATNNNTRNNRKKNNNTNKSWYAYESTRCVSNGTGSMRCVAVKANSRTNNNNTKKKTNNNNVNKNNKTMGLRRYGRRGIIGSL